MKSSLIYHSSSLIIAALFGVLYSLTPPHADDLLFMCDIKNLLSESEIISHLPEIISSRWKTESGRLGTFLSLPTLYLLPKYVFGFLTGIMIFIGLNYMPKIARCKAGSLLSWLMLTIYIFFFPWYDHLMLVSYGYNYVWGATLILLAIYYMTDTSRCGWGKTVAVSALAFCAGWMHEAFGAPLCAGFAVWTLGRHREIGVRKIVELLALVAGTAMTFLSPVFHTRAGGELKLLTMPWSEILLQVGPGVVIAMVFLSSIVCLILSKRRKAIFCGSWPEIALWSVAVAVSLAVMFRYYNGARTGAPLIIFASVGSACNFNFYRRYLHRNIANIVGVIISLLSVVSLTYSCIKENELRKENYRIVSLYQTSLDGTIYLDITYPKFDLTFYKTSVWDYHQRIPIAMWEEYYGRGKKLVILPMSLKNFSESESHPGMEGGWIFSGDIIMTSDIRPEQFRWVELVLPGGKTVRSRFRTAEFSTGGDEYIFVEPHAKVIDRNLEISDFRLIR